MKVFRELEITASPESMAAAVAEMEQRATDGWARDKTPKHGRRALRAARGERSIVSHVAATALADPAQR